MFMLGYAVPSLAGSHIAVWKIATIASAVVLFILLACLFLWWKRGRNIKGEVPWIWLNDYSLMKAHLILLLPSEVVCTRLHSLVVLICIVKCT